MKTDELISILASGGTAADVHALRRRCVVAIGWGAFATALAMAIVLGVRPDIGDAARLPMFWVKLAFPAVVAALAAIALVRLSRPGVRLGWVSEALAAPVLAVWILAVAVLLDATPGTRRELVLGTSWAECLASISVLAVPAFVALLWALKDYAAPTRSALAGAAAGLAAGGIAASVYALHCPEIAAPFIGTWYVIGMLIPTAAGALIGSRLLRW